MASHLRRPCPAHSLWLEIHILLVQLCCGITSSVSWLRTDQNIIQNISFINGNCPVMYQRRKQTEEQTNKQTNRQIHFTKRPTHAPISTLLYSHQNTRKIVKKCSIKASYINKNPTCFGPYSRTIFRSCPSLLVPTTLQLHTSSYVCIGMWSYALCLYLYPVYLPVTKSEGQLLKMVLE
jgi:hypothetical protein